MDPLWVSIAEFWWIAPVAAGAGVFAMLGLRHQRTVDARRLEFDASKLELHDARARAWAARGSLKHARAQLAFVQAERAASRATAGDVGAARRALQSAQRDLRAASAAVRVRRMRVSAARASLAATADPAQRPLARLMSAHDDLTARWLEYETDPARLIVFPSMSDGRVPSTAAFLTARSEAQRLRPASPQARITPVDFAAYRSAVDKLAHAFELAEQEAWSQARAAGMVPPELRPNPAAAWTAAAQQFLARSTEALAWANESISAMTAQRGSATTKPPAEEEAAPRRAAPGPAAAPAAEPTRAVWPVPSRTSHRPAS